MKKTMIISSFPGCGRTWCCLHVKKYKMCDINSRDYPKTDGWEVEYVNDVLLKAKSGLFDFIFIHQIDSILSELDKRHISYVIVEPNNMPSCMSDEKKRALIKQQWFGRIILRYNSNIKDCEEWFSLLKEFYDDCTSAEFTRRHNPIEVFLLTQDQYLFDILDDLYLKKEKFPSYTANSDLFEEVNNGNTETMSSF